LRKTPFSLTHRCRADNIQEGTPSCWKGIVRNSGESPLTKKPLLHWPFKNRLRIWRTSEISKNFDEDLMPAHRRRPASIQGVTLPSCSKDIATRANPYWRRKLFRAATIHGVNTSCCSADIRNSKEYWRSTVLPAHRRLPASIQGVTPWCWTSTILENLYWRRSPFKE